jgi:hypothetical protein
MISVLLPSRGRPESLLETMGGLLSLAADPGDVEFLVAADPDDGPTLALGPSLPGQARIWAAPERYGYKRIYEYFNALAGMAAGEWLFLWNDDAHMLTPRWDEVIRSEAPGILWPEADYAPEINTFPVWPAAWTRHLGHVSLDQSTDMWLGELGRMTGTQRKIPVRIRHEHRCGDVTAWDRDQVADVGTFHAGDMPAARERDAAKLRELLGL